MKPKTFGFVVLTLFFQNCLHAQADTTKEYMIEKDKLFRFTGTTELGKIKFSIRYPSTWDARESDMPHVIQKFIASALEGKPSYSVTIKRNAGTDTFSKKDIEIAYQNLQNFLPPGATIISTRTDIYLQDERAASIDYIMTTKGENTITHEDVQIYMNVYSILWKNYLIQITCGVSQKKIDKQQLIKLFMRYKSFFESAVNSFILVSKWE